MSQAWGCVTAICWAVKPSLTSYCRVIPRSCSACALIGSSRLTPVPTTRRVVPCKNAGAGNADRFAPTPTSGLAPSAAAASAAEPFSNVRRVTAGCSGCTLTGCEDLFDELFVFTPFLLLTPHRQRGSLAACSDISRALPPLSRARLGAPRIDHAWIPISYRRCQILECPQ